MPTAAPAQTPPFAAARQLAARAIDQYAAWAHEAPDIMAAWLFDYLGRRQRVHSRLFDRDAPTRSRSRALPVPTTLAVDQIVTHIQTVYRGQARDPADPRGVFRRAREYEKHHLGFYEQLVAQFHTTPETDLVTAILKEEQNHVALLERLAGVYGRCG